MQFGIPGYDDLVWDVSLVCDGIGSSTQHGPMASCNSVTTLKLQLEARSANSGDFAAQNIAFFACDLVCCWQDSS